MNLIRLQLLKDIRMLRVLIGLFLGSLFLDLAVSQGWLGMPVWQKPLWAAHRGMNWQQMMPQFVFVFGFILVMSAVFQDTPARENGFLRTRPVTARAIVVGKLLFVLLVVVGPAMLELTVHLLLSGVGVADLLGILGERLVLVVAAILLVGGFSACAENPKSLQGSMFAVGIAFALSLVLLSVLRIFKETANNWAAAFQPSLLRAEWVMATTGGGLLGMSFWIVRRRPAARRRMTVVGGIVGAAVLSATLLPPEIAIRPAGEAGFADQLGRLPLEIPPGGINLNQRRVGPRGLDQRVWRVTITAPDTEPALRLDAYSGSLRLKSADGNDYESGTGNWRKPIFNNRSNPDARDLRSIRAVLPEVAAFSMDSPVGPLPHLLIAADSLALPETDEVWRQPAELEADFRVRGFRWELAAELPLNERSTVTDGTGSWQVAASRHDTNISTLEIVLQRRQIWRRFTGDQERRDFGEWPGDHYRFFLFDPVTRTAISLRHFSARVVWNTGRHNGIGSAFLYLQHNLRETRQAEFTFGDPAGFRLLVLKQVYLGETTRQLTRRLIPDELRIPVTYSTPNRDNPDRVTVNRHFARLEAPPVDAGRAQVARHVYDVLQLIEAARYYPDADDEMVLRLARYVPAHTDLFLDGLAATSGASHSALEKAMFLALPEDSRQLVTARLRQDPGLCWLLTARGWLEDARAEVLALVDHPRLLPRAARQALLLLGDEPGVRERLIAELAAAPDPDLLDLLSRQPELAGPIDTTVRRLWHQRVPVLTAEGPPDPVLAVAMRQGLPAAHAEAMRTLRLLAPAERQRSYALLEALRTTTRLAGFNPRDRHNQKLLADRFSAVIDREFRFDPVRRRFVVVTKN